MYWYNLKVSNPQARFMSVLKFRGARRRFVAGVGGAFISMLCTPNARAQHTDSSSKSPLRSLERIKVGNPIVVGDNFGDLWVTVLADDGNLYSPSDDTLCFGVPEFFGKDQVRLFQRDFDKFKDQLTLEEKKEFQYAPIGFNRIEGDLPESLKGFAVNRMTDYSRQDGYTGLFDSHPKKPPDGCTWKTSGCTFLDGTLYLTLSRLTFSPEGRPKVGRWVRRYASIIKSGDYGKTWTRSVEDNFRHPMFPGPAFAAAHFIEYRNHGDLPHGSHKYVYATSTNGFWNNGDFLILGRVQRARIGALDATDWEFYSGGGGSNDSNWTTDVHQAKPILSNPGKLGETGAFYLPQLQRYVMIGWYYPGGGATAIEASTTTVWDFYESPTPWGPWRNTKSHQWNPQGYYAPSICPKFQSDKRLYVVTAGDWRNWWDHYRLTFVPIDLG